MASAAVKETRRVLRCFCNCSELTEEEVKRLYRLDAQATLIDQLGVKMLRSFLQQQRRGDKSIAEQQLDVYEKCSEYLMQPEILTLTDSDELEELGLCYRLVKDFTRHIRNGNYLDIAGCLTRIQGECRNNIEESEEYKAYKKAILEKLKQCT